MINYASVKLSNSSVQNQQGSAAMTNMKQENFEKIYAYNIAGKHEHGVCINRKKSTNIFVPKG